MIHVASVEDETDLESFLAYLMVSDTDTNVHIGSIGSDVLIVGLNNTLLP